VLSEIERIRYDAVCMTMKDIIKNWRTSGSAWKRFLYHSAKRLWLCFCVVIKAEQRSSFLTKIRFGKTYYQRATFTVPSRYPLLFQVCADYLALTEQPKIMSFGCSTGEEVFSIGQYLPHATIVGVDINRWCLKQCRKKNDNPNYSFVHRFSKEFEGSTDFDAIFCLAVFQRTENRTNQDNSKASGFMFEEFESEITMLDKKLRRGGLLIIDHADFSFEETGVAKKYQPLKSFGRNEMHRNRPLFDRENRKIAEEHDSYRVFVKC